jgi:spore coat polysaccharide biosynthesis predicted glycosyltransferase SpsG
MAEAAILTVAGKSVGFGHLRRCMTLGEALRKRVPVRFLVEGEGAALVEGFPVDNTLHASDLLIVDDYSVSAEKLAELRRRVRRVMVLDDLADRDLASADLVLNGTPSAESLHYRTRPECTMLLGPRYALLSEAFRNLPKRSLPPHPRRILVTLGGADPHRDTPGVVETVRAVLPDAETDVIIGPLFSDQSRVTAAPGVRVHPPQPNLSALMQVCDLAVTAGGQTTYELAASGLPTIALEIAANQRDNLRALANVPTMLAIARGDREALTSALVQLANDQPLRQKMSDSGRALFDGHGAERAAEALLREV